MVDLIEFDLKRPRPESEKIASIIEKDKELLKEYYAANFDEGVYEEEEVEGEGEEEEDNKEDEDVQQFTEQEIYEYINNKNISNQEVYEYKTPSKIVNYK
ncbi:MAG: hypothetical protein ACK5YA_00245, partial [bacterium]